MERNLTSGSVLKNIIIFSLPYFLSYFLQTLYGMADLYIIGQFEGVASTTAVLILFARPITKIISTPVEAVGGTVAYLTICFEGIPFITAYNVISAVFRGTGDSKSPMYFIAVACVANIALDYLFMGAFHLGSAGTALGTTLLRESRSASADISALSESPESHSCRTSFITAAASLKS